MLACWGILGSLIYEAGAQQPIAKEEAATKGPILVRLSGTECFGHRGKAATSNGSTCPVQPLFGAVLILKGKMVRVNRQGVGGRC
jgi:hypothetical protein